ncbi:MAG: BTAD domain-containing putative transcriptional regulator [Gemmatimonadota bacterium]|nr:BTAD domain-containing putative transcriptional regulator [Gemmatimonadota bacterium]
MATTAQATSRLSIVTLGRLGFDGRGSDDAARLLDQPKRLAVLLYLTMSQRGGTVSRDQIAAVFWPESNANNARNALRQTLSFVRGCLGEGSVTSVGVHGLAVAATVECDAVQFESLLDRDQREQALKLYRGEFLHGFHVAGSSEFTKWLDMRRSHLSQRAAKAAWDLSAEAETQRDFPAAAFWGKRALSHSPFSESEVQRLLRLLDRVGDFPGALRAFAGLERSLLAEFGARPTAETVRLAEEIATRQKAAGVSDSAGRRSVLGRRGTDRRVSLARWTGVERRSNPDRRLGDRRSGGDRRDFKSFPRQLTPAWNPSGSAAPGD